VGLRQAYTRDKARGSNNDKDDRDTFQPDGARARELSGRAAQRNGAADVIISLNLKRRQAMLRDIWRTIGTSSDGRPSQYFYWDDNPGRASTTRKMDQSQAKEAARALARAERAKLEHICSLCDGGGWVCERASRSAMAGTARLHLWRGRCALPSLQQRRCRRTAAAAKGV
jgi:hypothetical protein